MHRQVSIKQYAYLTKNLLTFLFHLVVQSLLQLPRGASRWRPGARSLRPAADQLPAGGENELGAAGLHPERLRGGLLKDSGSCNRASLTVQVFPFMSAEGRT